ncbi:unnamed protein product [Adineta steineri]|uniref:Purple acid phosphatase n=1 Tax=Adineta steineri TaxID=433720 RepID=A0A819X0U6_9BILA|nr:unnamed protein product [Adineta steineri]CAF4130577.1 unnamed protein product [Adineta steineri]
MLCLVFLFSFWLVLIKGDNHLYNNGPFGKYHSLKNLPNPYGCNRTLGNVISSISLSSININKLYVSSTFYVSNQEIIVQWNTTLISCKDDFIGIYSSEISFTDICSYFDYEFVQINQTNMSWQMINLRRPLEFRYYSRENNCSSNYTLIAKSSIVQPMNYNAPEQIHLAYSDRIDQMFISFVTNSTAFVPQCQYGFDSSSLQWIATGTTITYKASDMCEEPGNITGPQTFIDPGYMHTILLEDLRPSTTYFYRVGSDLYGWSSICSFTNRPVDKNNEVNLIAFGDMGVAPIQLGAKSTMDRVQARIISDNITCVLHIGDISYARGTGALWDAFMTQIDPIATHTPYMVGIGNHEYDHVSGGEKDPSGAPGPGGFRPSWGNYAYDSGGECAVPLVNRFHSPSNGNGLFWYSFNVGPIHIVYYSTEHDFLPSSPQYIWLEQDLRSVNRSLTPWLIVGSHRPMYTSITRDLSKITEMLQFSLEPMFYKYHVDINLFAHVHSYERSCPMYQQQCVNDGIIHVLIGMAGHSLDFDTYTGAKWSLYHDQQFGYTQIFANQTYLYFTYRHNVDDALGDEFQLRK